MEPQFRAIADHALLVGFAAEIPEDAHAKVVALDTAIGADMPVGVIETVPALVKARHVRIHRDVLQPEAQAHEQRHAVAR